MQSETQHAPDEALSRCGEHPAITMRVLTRESFYTPGQWWGEVYDDARSEEPVYIVGPFKAPEKAHDAAAEWAVSEIAVREEILKRRAAGGAR